MEVSIPLSDDDAFEEDRQVTIAMDSIRNGVELLNFYPIPQLRILIKDNDCKYIILTTSICLQLVCISRHEYWHPCHILQ